MAAITQSFGKATVNPSIENAVAYAKTDVVEFQSTWSKVIRYIWMLFKGLDGFLVRNKPYLIVGSLLAFLGYNVPLAIWASDIGLTDFSLFDVYDTRLLEAIPQEWGVYVFFFISGYTLGWVVYTHTTLCRKAGDQRLFELSVYSPYLFIFYSIGTLFGIGIIFFGGNVYPLIVIFFTFLYTLGQLIALGFVTVPLAESTDKLIKDGLVIDVWLIRVLIQNSIGLDAFWYAHQLLVQIGLQMTYTDELNPFDTNVSPEDSSTVVFSLVAAVLLVWFVLDVGFLDRFTRYLLTPYVTFIIYSAGILGRSDIDVSSRNGLFILLLLIVASVVAIVKLTVTIVRAFLKRVNQDIENGKP